MDIRFNRSIPLWANLLFYAVFAWLIGAGFLVDGSSSWFALGIAIGVPIAVMLGFVLYAVTYNRRVREKE